MAQAFISYRQIDDAQRRRVRDLAERIRATGVEVIFDQFHCETQPGGSDEGWTIWSEDQAEHTEKVLVIASAEWFQCYLKKAPPGTGLGAAAEAHVIHARITQAGTQARGIRIVVLDDAGSEAIPTLRLGDFPRFDLRKPGVFEEMIAWINAPSARSDTDAAAAEPPERPARGWVWTSTLASRAAGQWSVLACVETMLAVLGYWWIAWYFETHLHLLTSVFIAPLLLLRSPESIAAGVRWFQKDWFGFKNYEQWPRRRKAWWLGLTAAIAGVATFAVSHWLCHLWLPGLSGWPLICWTGAIGSLVLAFAVAASVAVAGEGAGVGERKLAVAVSIAVAGGAGGGLFVAGSLVAVSVPELITGLALGGIPSLFGGVVVGLGTGLAVRALIVRVSATLANLVRGFQCLPENWRENNFLTDSRLPAELLPGIRTTLRRYAWDGWLDLWSADRSAIGWLIFVIIGPILFLPAFLYRLNIKATAWFWWPLALLLKPARAPDTENAEMQQMCSPWTNPVTKVWTLFSVALGLGPLLLEFVDPTIWSSLSQQDRFRAVPAVWETFFAIRWAELAPWNVCQLIAAAAGIGILIIAGDALSHQRTGNWAEYHKKLAWHHGWMTFWRRINFGASLGVMILALGAMLIQYESARRHLPRPMLERVESFYGRWTPVRVPAESAPAASPSPPAAAGSE